MTPAPAPVPATIKVMLVDDSSVVRGLMQRWLQAEIGIEVAAVALNGKDAIRLARETQPNVIVLDVEMPEMDGITAIPQILSVAPRAKILMASGLTRRNAEISLKALSVGATDYIPKPEAGGLGAASFKRDLIEKIRALGAPRPVPAARGGPATPPPRTRPLPPTFVPQVLVIGSSTGGPQALQALIGQLAGQAPWPILIAQHMPPVFTTILADHLSKGSSAPACEATDGMALRPGSIYVAPGDNHLRVVKKNGVPSLALDKSPPVNFCRPAVDPLFESAAEIYGPGVLGLVLTGMGQDGKRGAEAIVARGGAMIVQDEATSVVWGMPGAVARAGLASIVKPLAEIGPAILGFKRQRF